jgi:hypothetical protein
MTPSKLIFKVDFSSIPVSFDEELEAMATTAIMVIKKIKNNPAMTPKKLEKNTFMV